MARSDTNLPLSVEQASSELQRLALLKRIADQLRAPHAGIDAMTRSDESLAEAAELFRLWQALEDPESRQRLLVLARELVVIEASGSRLTR